jgi:hypothetical protein
MMTRTHPGVGQALAVERKRDADIIAAEQAISALYSVKKPETT